MSIGLTPKKILTIAVSILLIIGSMAVMALTIQVPPSSRLPRIFFASGATIDRASPAAYLPCEPVGILFSLVNYQAINVSIPSVNGCIFSFQIRVNNTEGPLIYDSVKHGYCIPASAIKTLGPNQTYRSNMTWDQVNDSGVAVSDGEYEVMSTFNSWNGPAGQLYIGRGVPTTGIFYFEVGGVDFSTYSSGKDIRITPYLVNRAAGIVRVGLSTCSFGLDILNSARGVIYNSTRHSDCRNVSGEVLVAPEGSLCQTFYWDQRDDVWIQVPPGTYIIVAHAFVFGGTQRYDFSKELPWHIQITSS